MGDKASSIRRKIQSLLNGEQYGPGDTWDTLDAWADVADFYHTLDDAILRANFERVVVEFLYSEEMSFQEFAIQMCYELKIRAAIPKLLMIARDWPEHPSAGVVCMALGEMEVKEAADVFESNNYIAELFQVDFHRAIPLIQKLMEDFCEEGYDPRRARKIPRPPLSELSRPLCDLYVHFGTKGLLLLLEELSITNEHQVAFVLDAVTEMSYRVANDRIHIMFQSEPLLAQGHQEIVEIERQAMVEDVKQWLQSRL